MRNLTSVANFMALKQKIHPVISCSKTYRFVYYFLFMSLVWFQILLVLLIQSHLPLSLRYSSSNLATPLSPNPHCPPAHPSHSGLFHPVPHTWAQCIKFINRVCVCVWGGSSQPVLQQHKHSTPGLGRVPLRLGTECLPCEFPEFDSLFFQCFKLIHC